MNTHGIERHYEHLRPEERVALIMAAFARGDEHDRDRLADATPFVSVRRAETFPVSQALLEVTLQEFAERVSTAALFWRTQRAADDVAADERDAPLAERLERIVGVYAYLLITHAAGWRLFCAGRRLTPDAAESFTANVPGIDTLKMAEDEAGSCALAASDVIAYFRRGGRACESVVTPDSHAERLERVYAARLEFWGGKYDATAPTA